MKLLFSAAMRWYCIFLCKIFYPKCPWLITWNPLVVRGYPFLQKVLNINGARRIPWPVHFTSKVSGNITVGDMTAPGMMPGFYINAISGVNFGSNIWIGPGVKIISANHDPNNLARHLSAKPMEIGSNVWIGANAILLPNVSIGDDVIVGAGAVVTRDVPAGKVVVGNPARILKENQTVKRDLYGK